MRAPGFQDFLHVIRIYDEKMWDDASVFRGVGNPVLHILPFPLFHRVERGKFPVVPEDVCQKQGTDNDFALSTLP